MMNQSHADLIFPPNIRHHICHSFYWPHVLAEVRVFPFQKVPISGSIYKGESVDSTLGNELTKDRSFFRAEVAVLHSQTYISEFGTIE